MKSAHMTLLVLALSLGLATSARAAGGADDCQGRGQTKLIVQVAGVRVAKGEMAITVYPDDAARFLAPHKKLLRVRAVTQAPMTTGCFWLPAPGHYAVAIYHDESGDRKFDRTAIGLPAEGFGFSNNPSTLTAIPAFRAARFKAGPGETRIRINLRYLR